MKRNVPSLSLGLTLALCISASMPVRAQATTAVRTGSGFAISRTTHIVTNAHVVAQCKSVRVLSGAQQASGRVLAIDVDADLAVLQTSLSVPKTMAMRSSPALRLGESVIAFGFPLTGALSQGGNLTTGNVSALAGLRDDPKYIQVTAPVQPGNSGGPLLDAGGNVIGVITAKLDALAVAKRTGDVPQNVNFAVRAEVLEAFLQTHKIPYDVAVTDGQLAVADVAEAAKQASVRIECTPSGVPTSQPGTVRVSPQLETPFPQPEVTGRPAVPSDAVQEQMLQQVELTEVRTPYPGTAPAIRELEVTNRSPYSVLQITVGWLEGSARQCPVSRSAYRGTREVFVSLKAGESGTTMGEFSEQAKYFCVLAAQFIPPGRRGEPAAAAPQPPGAPSPQEPSPPETTAPAPTR
jgi:S1-C subfamily serine protease